MNDHRLSVGAFVRRLEETVIATLLEFGIEAQKAPDAIGVWVPQSDGRLAKIGALGVRIRRGASMHGVALNVTTDLRYFDLIVPCGLVDRPVTSVREVLGARAPSVASVRDALARRFQAAFSLRVIA